jgi:hypothetical protein
MMMPIRQRRIGRMRNSAQHFIGVAASWLLIHQYPPGTHSEGLVAASIWPMPSPAGAGTVIDSVVAGS